MLSFNFGNAFLHYNRTGAPNGFVWKLMLSYALAMIVVVVIALALLSGVMGSLVGADPEAIEAMMLENMGAVIAIYAVLIPLGMFFGVIFEACYQRRYMRRDGFRLRFGGDELRILVVYLIWFAFYIMMYLLTVAAVIAGGQINIPVGAIAGIVTGGLWLYLSVRFSAASSLTTRDRKIRFASSWRVTKGRFWVMLGAYLTWMAVAFVGYILIATIVGIAFAGIIAGAGGISDPDALTALGPVTLIFAALFYFGVLGLVAYFYYIWAGPAALAARTDPDHAGHDDPSEAFT